jgi:hypothetical protein
MEGHSEGRTTVKRAFDGVMILLPILTIPAILAPLQCLPRVIGTFLSRIMSISKVTCFAWGPENEVRKIGTISSLVPLGCPRGTKCT